MSKQYFITGGAGFIGSNYAARLLERGEKITIYDNLSRHGHRLNLEWLRNTFGERSFEVIVGDIRDASLLTESVKDADVIYTDTWTSMGQEEEAARRERVFPPYQVNEQLVSEASERVIVLHCLPAHRNHEITDAVADGPHSRLFPQAHNRMHAQKAILVKLLAD